MKRIELIDYLRGISIFTIVVMHLCQGYANGALNKVLAFGGAGVHVFFMFWLRTLSLTLEETIGICFLSEMKVCKSMDSIRYSCVALGRVVYVLERRVSNKGGSKPVITL